jgi:hypothetical protein
VGSCRAQNSRQRRPHRHGPQILEKLRFDPERPIWGVDTISSGGTCETFEARHVVSSAPILELLAALSPAPLTLLHARALKYRDFITVVLIGRTERT